MPTDLSPLIERVKAASGPDAFRGWQDVIRGEREFQRGIEIARLSAAKFRADLTAVEGEG